MTKHPLVRPLTMMTAAWLAALCFVQTPSAAPPQHEPSATGAHRPRFQTAEECVACHNGLTTAAGEDVSIGASWRGSMMANAARDPYWQAAVRRETMDHPSVAKEIEDECSVCHMPMARTLARAAARPGEIFKYLPIASAGADEKRLAADGVSCTLCHQIGEERLGAPASFTGGFIVHSAPPSDPPTMFGPFDVEPGRAALMHSATGVKPAEALHIRSSELCATCHTLHTQAFGPGGKVIGTLAEQVPYLEWRHSAFREQRSCQSCHMPEVAEPTPIASVLGEPREGFSRHSFTGGNFFMLRMLNRYRTELGVVALPAELEAAARSTLQQLQTATAQVALEAIERSGTTLRIGVAVRNQAGHKLPTGYPSRRVWLHLAVRDSAGTVVFESGAVAPTGAIAGNDNDADPSRHEPHYREIRSADQVQIYEAVMVDGGGAVTTGLLSGVRYVKDNRLLPAGFDKATAAADVAVHGDARTDADFIDASDRMRYVVDLPPQTGPVQVEVELRYQPISYRWAQNLKGYDAPETRRFVSYYESMAAQSSTVLARDAREVK